MTWFSKILFFLRKKRINENSLLSKRIRKFKSVKRGYYSLIVLITLYVFSFFLPLFVGEEPIYANIKNEQWDEGEEYVDTNKNGKYDKAESWTDRNKKYDKGERYIDTNKNGKWDDAEEFTDQGDNLYNQGERWEDLNRNSKWDDAEEYIDTNKNGKWDEGEKFDDLGNGRRNRREEYTDLNNNKKHDKGEPFEDKGNGKWDDAEPFTDNMNGEYDDGEPFEDLNNNGKWDDAEEYTDGNGKWDQGEEFADCSKDRSICDGDDGWEDSKGNGKWDDGEPFTDEYKRYYPALSTLFKNFSFGLIKTNHYKANDLAPPRLGGKNINSFRQLKTRLNDDSINESFILMPLYPYSPKEVYVTKEQALERNSLNSPSSQNWFGTDKAGRDVFARIMYGFNVSISFALVVTFFSYIIGVSIGASMGYFGAKFDLFGQRIIEVFGAIPFLYVMMIVSQMMEPSFFIFALLLVIIGGWIGISYYIRGEFYREKAKDYVSAAVSMGGSTYRIMFKHILPNALTPIITFAPFAVIGYISALVSLDYLGFVPEQMITWGEILKQGNEEKKWFLLIFPLAFMAMTLFMITFIGEAIREAFDPKVHSRLR